MDSTDLVSDTNISQLNHRFWLEPVRWSTQASRHGQTWPGDPWQRGDLEDGWKKRLRRIPLPQKIYLSKWTLKNRHFTFGEVRICFDVSFR